MGYLYPFYTSLAQRKVEHGPIYMYVIRVQISGPAYPNFAKFSAPATYGYEYDRVFLWRRCNMLCTSGLVDDVVFSDNGPYGAGDVRPVCLNMTPNRAACISQRSVR